MTDSLNDILGKFNIAEPPEIATIKTFVKQHVDVIPVVELGQMNIIIVMPSAASAGALRLCLHELQSELSVDKKLLIRIR